MDINNLGLVSIPAITAICLLAAQAIKATALDNKWLPVLCGALGMALGVVATFIMPDYAGVDYMTAAAVGIVSGLAATGVNQVYKQLTGGGKDAD
ncbi:phage holin family protein [Agathobaculum sp. NTUH-O15-33]|uniref:phage holin family protein n=1 Tax=Agathobaculum sp. NTUH-O15-33 TaxID=3079302 RepID=UPI002958934D|nr:phage holin family protein [Agathobaculum sp. NTUH-O15-33]WNX84349.1 phage holin family protein [Agathobaculum sp. NTUH-O15-33]